MKILEITPPFNPRPWLFYHVTPSRNVSKIMRDGLVPQIGARSRLINEPAKGIYLFHSQEEAEDAVMNWLGDQFGENIRLALLAVTVPSDATLIKGADYETILTTPIPAQFIKVLSMDI